MTGPPKDVASEYFEKLGLVDKAADPRLIRLKMKRHAVNRARGAAMRRLLDRLDLQCEWDERTVDRIVRLEKELDMIDRVERYIRGQNE